MIFETLLVPAWKTRDYSFDLTTLKGTYLIYLKRLGKFYMKNEHGVKFRFSAKDVADEAFYDEVYKKGKSISAGMVTVVSNIDDKLDFKVTSTKL